MQEVLDTNNLQAENRTDARKEKLEADAVWDLMGSAERIVVAKGKSVETFVPDEDDRDAILKAVLGRSGSLRAPTVKTRNIFFVGYNDALYADVPFANG
ncbi:MAG: ArsC family (seleno)protein [Candidatus Poribacteria bacterium]|nr:ArsC family (seleno)protein [Candidatus Poribacteria bacterium]